MTSITPLKKKPDNMNRSGPNHHLIIHYSIDGLAICEASCRLSADARFVELPIPVIHQMMRGPMK